MHRPSSLKHILIIALFTFVLCLSTLAHATIASEFTIDPSRLNKSVVRYRDQSQITDFPTPVVYFRAVGLSAGSTELVEIKEKILYPLIEKSQKPITAIVLQWFPGQPNGVLWSDGETRESTIARTSQGHYNAKAYEILFAKPTP